MPKIKVQEVVTVTRTCYLEYDDVVKGGDRGQATGFIEDYLDNFAVRDLQGRDGYEVVEEFAVTIDNEVYQCG
tara:strand:+ start:129 stop:347 length:219 start_codon:yes stop_codon:yes gene_type:complete